MKKRILTILLLTLCVFRVSAWSHFSASPTLMRGTSITIDPTKDMGLTYDDIDWMNPTISNSSGGLTITSRKAGTSALIFDVVALKRGTYTLTVKMNFYAYESGYGRILHTGYTATYTINVVDVTQINMPSSLNLQVGEYYTFAPQILETGATSELTWTSSNTSVALVDNEGKVRCLRVGTSNITCTAYNGVSVTCKLTVIPVIASDFKLEPSELELEPKETFSLNPVFTPTNTTDKSVTYRSSNTRVATVDSDGNVTGVSEGTCTITGVTNDGSSLSSSCNVKVAGIYSIEYVVNGEIYLQENYRYEQAIQAPEAPKITGHTFKEWSGLPATMPAKNIRVEALYTVNKYLLTYMIDDAVYKKDSVEYNAVINLLSPVKEGYSFSGWAVQDDLGINEGILDDLEDLFGAPSTSRNAIPERMPAEDLTLYGHFNINKYLLTYKVDGAVYQTDSVTFGEAIVPIEAPIKNGFIFSGWKNLPEYMPAYDVTVSGSFVADGDETDISTLDNVIYLDKTKGYVGQQLSLSIQMKNSAEIRAFQFDLYFPEGVNVVKNSKGRIQGSLSPGRLPDDDEHTLTISEQPDGGIRFLCGSQYDETFTGTDGEIITLNIQISNELADGEYPIVLSNVKLTETDISKFYETAYLKSTLTISSYIPGDINGDGKVDVSDYIGVANYIINDVPSGFIHNAADVDSNGIIDVSDYIGIANLIVTGTIYGEKM